MSEQQARLIEGGVRDLIAKLRIRLASTEPDGTRLVDALNREAADGITGVICGHLGIDSPHREHPWAKRGWAKNLRKP